MIGFCSRKYQGLYNCSNVQITFVNIAESCTLITHTVSSPSLLRTVHATIHYDNKLTQHKCPPLVTPVTYYIFRPHIETCSTIVDTLVFHYIGPVRLSEKNGYIQPLASSSEAKVGLSCTLENAGWSCSVEEKEAERTIVSKLVRTEVGDCEGRLA